MARFALTTSRSVRTIQCGCRTWPQLRGQETMWKDSGVARRKERAAGEARGKIADCFSVMPAYGAVAPKRQNSDRRFLKVIGAAALAMAMTALILVASGGAEDSQASAAEVVWTELADPQRVALAQSLMEGNRQLQLTKLQGDPSEPAFLATHAHSHALSEDAPAAEAPAEAAAEAPVEETPAEEAPAEEGGEQAEEEVTCFLRLQTRLTLSHTKSPLSPCPFFSPLSSRSSLDARCMTHDARVLLLAACGRHAGEGARLRHRDDRRLFAAACH
eukprot:1088843-Rhodomonas_salina.1